MSLSGYINDVHQQLSTLRRDIEALQRENKELKLNLDRRQPCQWWQCSKARTRTTAEVKMDVEELIQSSTLDDYLKHGR